MIKSGELPIRKLTHLEAVKSDLPILREVGTEFTQPLKAIYFKAVSDYISIYHPGSDNQPVSTEFIELLFENYYTLNPIDVFAFINYIKLNKPDVSGHKITPTELIESLQQYIELKLDIIEQNIISKKSEFQNEPIADKVSEALQKIIDRNENKKKEERIKRNENINNKISATEQLELDKTIKFHFLQQQVKDEKITEQEFLTEWNNFLHNQNK